MEEFKSSIDVQISPEVMNCIHAQTKLAVDQALYYANQVANQIIEQVKTQISSSIKPQIMAIQIDNRPVHKVEGVVLPILKRMVVNARIGLNTLLVGPAGSGKTFAAQQLAEALELPFGHLCLTAGASETWLFGRQTPNGFVEGRFSQLYRSGGVFLGDELDAADPNLLLSINTALANGSLYNPISGETIAKHENFVFVGAANTFGKGGNHVYTGRSRLDAATLDRFVVLQIDYSEELEQVICPDDSLRTVLQTVRKVLKDRGADEVLSTRAMLVAYKQKQAGISEDEIFSSICSSWSQGLASIFDEVRGKGQKTTMAKRK
jgi:cobaltochelatase CobS